MQLHRIIVLPGHATARRARVEPCPTLFGFSGVPRFSQFFCALFSWSGRETPVAKPILHAPGRRRRRGERERRRKTERPPPSRARAHLLAAGAHLRVLRHGRAGPLRGLAPEPGFDRGGAGPAPRARSRRHPPRARARSAPSTPRRQSPAPGRPIRRHRPVPRPRGHGRPVRGGGATPRTTTPARRRSTATPSGAYRGA